MREKLMLTYIIESTVRWVRDDEVAGDIQRGEHKRTKNRSRNRKTIVILGTSPSAENTTMMMMTLVVAAVMVAAVMIMKTTTAMINLSTYVAPNRSKSTECCFQY